jgi:mRNA interferase MazF
MKRGSICWVNLEPVFPPEMGKIRPAIVVSNSEQNIFLQSVVVIPISSRPGEIWPLRVKLEMPRSKTSFAVLPGIRQVSKERIQAFVGTARPADIERIDEALSFYLND